MLVVDKKFHAQLPSLSNESRSELERLILHEGIRDPIVYWINDKDEHVVVDGHNRLEICQKHGIAFETINIIEIDPNVLTRDDVEAWIDGHQIGKRNLSDAEFKLAVGRHYNRTKRTPTEAGSIASRGSRKKISKSQSPAEGEVVEEEIKSDKDEPARTAAVVGDQFGVSARTVRRSAKMAEIHGIMVDADEPELAGFVKEISQKDLTDDWNEAHGHGMTVEEVKANLVTVIRKRFDKAQEKARKKSEKKEDKGATEEAPVKAVDLQRDVKPITKKEAEDILVRLRHSDPKIIVSLCHSLWKEDVMTSLPLQSKELAALSSRIISAPDNVKKAVFDYVVQNVGNVLTTHIKKWSRKEFGDKVKSLNTPTLQEVEAYAVGKIEDEKAAKWIAKNFWEYYESCGWVQGKEGKKPIKDWTLAFGRSIERSMKWYQDRQPAIRNDDDFEPVRTRADIQRLAREEREAEEASR